MTSIYNQPMNLSRVLIVLMFFLAACEPGDNSLYSMTTNLSSTALTQDQVDNFKNPFVPHFLHFDTEEDNLSLYEFECDSCPLSVGKLVSTYTDGNLTKPSRFSGNCKGGLIEDDLFLTNEHCLPADLLQKGADCSKQINILFPTINDVAGEVVKCKEVVAFSVAPDNIEDATSAPDWALIRLEKSLPGRVTEVKSLEISDKENLVAFIPAQQFGTTVMSYHKINCEAVQKTIQNPFFDDDISPVAYFACDDTFTQGFSGTLLFKEVDGKFHPMATMNATKGVTIKSDDRTFSDKIIASPVACITKADEFPELCQFDGDQKKAWENVILNLLEPIYQDVANELAVYVEDKDHPVVWEEMTEDLLENGDLPLYIQQRWEDSYIKTLSDRFSEDGLFSFFLTTNPFVPVCLKKEFDPTKNIKFQKTKTLDMSLILEQDSLERISARHEIRHQEVGIYVNSAGDGTVVLGPLSPSLPPLESEALYINRHGYNSHRALPICP